MVYLHMQNTNFGVFWKVLEWKLLVYLMVILYVLWIFGIFCGHFVCFIDF
jgi:hypothetical protein